METTTLKVTGMMCEACVGHVTRALKHLPGVASVAVDLQQGKATVQHTAVAHAALLAAVDEAGYQAEVVPAIQAEAAN